MIARAEIVDIVADGAVIAQQTTIAFELSQLLFVEGKGFFARAFEHEAIANGLRQPADIAADFDAALGRRNEVIEESQADRTVTDAVVRKAEGLFGIVNQLETAGERCFGVEQILDLGGLS